MLFVLIASVLSRVAHKKLLASEKTDIRYGMGVQKTSSEDETGHCESLISLQYCI